MFKQLSLRMKLISLCIFLSLICVVVGLISYKGSKDVSSNYDLVVDEAMPNLNDINDAYLEYQNIRINLRTLGINGITADTAKSSIDNMMKSIEKLNEVLLRYKARTNNPDQKKLLETLEIEWVNFTQIGEKAIAVYKNTASDNRSELERIFFIDCPASAAKFDRAIVDLKLFELNNSKTFVADAKSVAQTTVTMIFVLAIISIGIGLTFGYFFSTKVSNRLIEIASMILATSEKTSLASNDLNSASSQLSQGSTESAASLQETVSSLEELSSMVKLNSDHAREANTLSQKSLESAIDGEEKMKNLISAMENMSKSSKKIEEITNVIDDIAFQTNLLALNAAVEAARAGDQGKGFAVVADAVRTLAQRSSVAAKDINDLISENVRMNMESSQITNESGEALKNIVTSVKRVADLNNEISAASQEQANGIEQISKAMNQLDTAIQQNASSAQEVSGSSNQMSTESQKLFELVSNLKGFVNGSENEQKEKHKLVLLK